MRACTISCEVRLFEGFDSGPQNCILVVATGWHFLPSFTIYLNNLCVEVSACVRLLPGLSGILQAGSRRRLTALPIS